jgi:hypothetical protein
MIASLVRARVVEDSDGHQVLRVPSIDAPPLRPHALVLHEVLRRAVAFKAELACGGRNLPTFVLPDTPSPRQGRCLSCGVKSRRYLRCRRCLIAIYLALECPGALPEVLRRG